MGAHSCARICHCCPISRHGQARARAAVTLRTATVSRGPSLPARSMANELLLLVGGRQPLGAGNVEVPRRIEGVPNPRVILSYGAAACQRQTAEDGGAESH